MCCACRATFALPPQAVTDPPSPQNTLQFISTLPPEFSTMILRDYMAFEKDYRMKLLRIPEFSDWMRKNGRLLTDA